MIPGWERDARAGHAVVPVLAVALRRRAGPGARARPRAARARRRRPGHRARATARRPSRASPPSGRAPRFPSNGSVAPIAAGRAVARRTLEALRTFAARRPAPARAALAGRRTTPRSSAPSIPAVGTFHSARAGRNAWYETLRLAAPADDAPARGRAPRCRRRRSARSTLTFGERVRDRARTASTSSASRTADPWPSVAPGDPLRRPPRAPQGPRRAARRVRRARARRDALGRGDGPRPTSLRARGVPPRRVARPRLRRREGRAPARRDGRVLPGDRRRVVRRRAARGDGRRHRAWSRPTSTATATSPAPTARRCSSRPATPTRCRAALRALLDDPAARPSSSWPRAAPGRRVLDDAPGRARSSTVYERAIARTARCAASADPRSAAGAPRRRTSVRCIDEHAMIVVIVIVVVVVLLLFFWLGYNGLVSGATGSTTRGRRSTCSSSAATTSSRTWSRR